MARPITRQVLCFPGKFSTCLPLMLLNNVAFAQTHLFQGLTNEGGVGFLMGVFPRWPKLRRRADILMSLVHRITTGSRNRNFTTFGLGRPIVRSTSSLPKQLLTLLLNFSGSPILEIHLDLKRKCYTQQLFESLLYIEDNQVISKLSFQS